MKKVINIIKNNWILIFIIVQPLLDMVYYFQYKHNMTPTTWLIRIIILAIVVCILFFKSKDKKKIIILNLPFILFYIFHILNLYRIGTLQFISDSKYFLFVFELPVLTTLFIEYLKDNKEQIKKIKQGFFYSFLIISISIIISTITHTAQCTYELNDMCVGILGWFYPSDTVFLIICALAPWAMYYVLKKGIYSFSIIYVLAFLILYTNGSKSCYLTLVASLILMLYNMFTSKDVIYKKSKISITALILLLSLSCYSKSFTYYRGNVAEEINNNNEIAVTESFQNIIGQDQDGNKTAINTKETNSDIILKVLESSYIYKDLIDIHGYHKVLNALDKDITPELLSNNRYRKVLNAKIEYNNSDTITKLLGFGYSKVAVNSLDLENDLTAIFYFYGYIGFILYIIYLIYFIILLLKTFINNHKIIFDSELVTLAFLLFLTVLGGEYTGAFLRKANSNIFLVFYLCMIYFKCATYSSKIDHNPSEIFKLFDKTYNLSKEEYLKKIENRLKSNKKTFIVTANPEAFMLAEKDPKYKKILLDKNTEIVPDGIGLVKAGRILGYDIKERIPGIDIASELLKYANKDNKKVYLFGAKPEVIGKMKNIINEQYSNIKLIGTSDGYVADKDKVFQDIKKKEPDLILVALGMPMQEKLIYQYLKEFKKGIFIGVGGSFDVLSGSKKRAPQIFIKTNTEWLYRIAKEPKRLKRFYDNNIKFILKTYHLKNVKKDN